MKKYLLILAAALSFAACDNSEEPSAPFDDLIAGFDIAKMDQVQFVDALTSSFVEEVDGMVHMPNQGWIPLAELLGRNVINYLFYADGGCWACLPFNNGIGPLCPPYHAQVTWGYDATTSELLLGETNKKKILYYKNDRLILEHIAYDVNGGKRTYRVVYQLHFGEEVRKDKAEFYKTTWEEVRDAY